MKTSVLSLHRVNNINRQIKLLKKETKEISHTQEQGTIIQLKSGNRIRVRDFHEFYIDDKPLIQFIGEAYWKKKLPGDNPFHYFFDTHVGCLGSFGKHWDDIFIQVLLKRNFKKKQIDFILEKSCLDDLHHPSMTNKEMKNQIIEDTRNEFLFYCCQDCGDAGCGGITFNIIKENHLITWSDDDKLKFTFDYYQYESAFKKHLHSK